MDKQKNQNINNQCQPSKDSLLPVSDAPNNKTVWACVRADEDKWFWILAERIDNDWVGLHAWSEGQCSRTFDDYGWTVLGWANLVTPHVGQGYIVNG